MLIRPIFVTNSSSSSVVGWGVTVDRSRWDELDQVLPWKEGVFIAHPRDDDVIYVYIVAPGFSVDRRGYPYFTDPEKFRDHFHALKKFLKDNGIDEIPKFIEDSWMEM